MFPDDVIKSAEGDSRGFFFSVSGKGNALSQNNSRESISFVGLNFSFHEDVFMLSSTAESEVIQLS